MPGGVGQIVLDAPADLSLEYRAEIGNVGKTAACRNFFLGKIVGFQQGSGILDPQRIQVVLGGGAVQAPEFPTEIGGGNAGVFRHCINGQRGIPEVLPHIFGRFDDPIILWVTSQAGVSGELGKYFINNGGYFIHTPHVVFVFQVERIQE